MFESNRVTSFAISKPSLNNEEGSLARCAKVALIILLVNPNGPRVIELLEFGITPPGLASPWRVLHHDKSLFLSVVTEVKVSETLCSSEDLVTGNLLIHVF